MNGESGVKSEADPAPPGGALYVFATGVLLGLVPIFSAALREQNWVSETAILVRLLLTIAGSVAVILYLRFTRPETGFGFRLQPGHIWYLLGYGVVSIAVVNFLYLKSLEYAPASVAVFSVFAAAPTTTLAVTWLRKKTQPTRRELGLTALIIFGCILVNRADGWTMNYWRGAALATGAGICYGLYSIFGEKVCREYSGPYLLFWQFIFAGAATTAFFCIFPSYHAVFGQLLNLATSPTLAVWIPALGLGLAATFLPYLFYGIGLSRGLKPTTASALTLLEPVSTTVLAWVFLSQMLGAWQLVGCALVMAASILLSRRRTSRR